MNKIEITLHQGSYPTNEVRDFIEKVCRKWGLVTRDAYQIKTVIDEALTNIVRHAYKKDGGKIKIQLTYKNNTMMIKIRDWGTPMVSRKRTGPTDLVKKKKDHGLGLVMIDRLMDKVTRIRRNNFNELTMKKQNIGEKR
jgi:anti-sigma regulatory factor (Ser/Thr protein kinase)